MNDVKHQNADTEIWSIYLALFSLGIDGLAYLIYARERASAFVSIPILLTLQAVVFVHFFRSTLPAYRSLDQMNSEHSTVYMKLIRIALTLPALIATAIWTILPSLSSTHR
jgi:hypothetical protein